MTESELKPIIRIVTEYFYNITGAAAVMGLPYIKRDGDPVFDYTGVIGISGARRGGVYYTAGRDLLAEFGRSILGEEPLDDSALGDLVGEMTNTIAGNMREIFGASFLISVPIILTGKIDTINMRLKPPVFVIPIKWKDHTSHLAVGLE
ncbi:MAG: chemotaxis protein CheX [Spirochaetaceae bacterium]|jgi:chemotaxis protein CheX|nr:chemotaxis protein CheX [Spirochaetaceae bacterium]